MKRVPAILLYVAGLAFAQDSVMSYPPTWKLNPDGSIGPVAGRNVTIGATVLDGKTYNCPGVYANLNACLDAAKAYVTTANDGTGKAVRIILPEGTISLTGPYTLRSGMQFKGVKNRLVINQGSITPPTDADLLILQNGGTWIDCGGAQCFTGSELSGVAFEDLGFKNFTKIAVFGGDNVAGISFSYFNNIFGLGNTTLNSSPSGFDLYNFQHVTMNGVRFAKVNTGLHLISQVDGAGPGNSVFIDVFTSVYTQSVANGNNNVPGLWIEVLPTSGTGQTSALAYLHFVNPQVNSYSGDGTGTDVIIQGSAAAPNGYITGLIMDGLMVEAGVLNGVYADYLTASEINITDCSNDTNGVNLTANSQRNILTSSHNVCTAVNSDPSNIFHGLWTALASGNVMNGAFRATTGTFPGGGNGASSMPVGTTFRGDSAQVNGPIDLGPQGTATNGTNYASGPLSWTASYWNGSAAASDIWSFKNVFNPANGTNPSTLLTLYHTGTSGSKTLDLSAATNIKIGDATIGSGQISSISDDGSNTYIKGTGGGGWMYLYSSNTLHAALPSDGGIKLISAAGSCDSGHEGTLLYVTGTPSLVKMCMKTSTSAYAFQTILTAP